MRFPSPRRNVRSLFVLAILLLTCSVATAYEGIDRPALVVVVSVDQWRYEYFERFNQNLASDGIAKRVQENGVWFDNCFHQHAFTFTGPGHSVLMTGSYPTRSGIIDNNWYDRKLGQEVYCVSDEKAELIGTTSPDTKVSPRRLLVDTVGDQLKMASGFRSKVFGVSIKDRAAILMAGRLADGAYWMSKDGKWITSSHYRDSLPGYLRNINEQKVPFRFAGKTWNRLLDAEAYTHGEEKSEFEIPIEGMTKDFPHVMPNADDENYVSHLACSPFGNEATLDAAREVVIHEKLGADKHPDVLAINLSSTDYVGHAFGPYSLEVEDMTYRTDKALGEFTAFLDKQVGSRGWMLFLTADHGVAPIPERAAKWGLLAKRNPFGEKDDRGNYEEERQHLEGSLRKSLGVTTSSVPLVDAVVSNQVFLNQDHPKLQGANAELARRITRNHLVGDPFVAHAATREQLLQDCSGNEMLHMLQRSFHARRSGDVLFVLKPYAFSSGAAATHGSPWHYDRHVPLMILSNSFRMASESLAASQVSPAQIAPTIARVLQIETPGACTETRLELHTK